MTIQEAIKILNQPSTLHGDAIRLAIEALEIADRLEHADVTKHKKAYYNHDDSEHGDGYCIGFQDGYELALADIRGDNNG